MKTAEEVKRDNEAQREANLTSQERAQREEAARQEAARREAQTRPATERASRGRYQLMATHVIEGKTLPPGTEVGEGTEHPFDALPSNQMMGLDEEGKARVNDVHQRLYGRDAPWHSNLAEAQRLDREEQEKQRSAEREAEPVSHAQAYEQGKPWQGNENPGPPPPPHQRPPVISGDTSHPMGPATADQDIENPNVAVRTTRPLVDQMPERGGAPSGGTQQPKG